MKKIFNLTSIKIAQGAPPALPPAMPPGAPPAMTPPAMPGGARSGDIAGVDASKLDNDPTDDHVNRINSFLKPLLINHDLDTALALACAADGSRVSPGMLDVAMTGEKAPFVRKIVGIDIGPSLSKGSAPTGQSL